VIDAPCFLTTALSEKEKGMKKGLLAAIIAGLLVIGFVGVVPTFAQSIGAQTETTTTPVTSDAAEGTLDDCAF
jgi:hypothetical protein